MFFFFTTSGDFDFGAVVVVIVIICIVTWMADRHGEPASYGKHDGEPEGKRHWSVVDREKSYWKAVMDGDGRKKPLPKNDWDSEQKNDWVAYDPDWRDKLDKAKRDKPKRY